MAGHSVRRTAQDTVTSCQEGKHVQLADVVDLGHLARYTMGDPGLEKELLGMFQSQLDELIRAIERADDVAAWKLAVHTLKGAAMGVGAFPLARAAAAQEKAGFDAPASERRRLHDELKAHTSDFNAAYERWRAMMPRPA